MQGTFNNVASFIAGTGGVTRNARVTVNTSGEAVLAGINDPAIGIAEYAAAAGESVAVRLYGAGTMQMIAAKVLTTGELVYGAADGKISDVAVGSTIVGRALEAAAADGDIIHVAPFGGEVAQ